MTGRKDYFIPFGVPSGFYFALEHGVKLSNSAPRGVKQRS
nr:MAG TPA: hypothetical protein [Caudoviricetes sp.]